jgi:hypothetical protein
MWTAPTTEQIEADLRALEVSLARAGAALACTFSVSAEFEAATVGARLAHDALAFRFVPGMRVILAIMAAALACMLASLCI